MSDPVGELLRRVVADGHAPGAVWRVDGPDGTISRGAVGSAAIAPEVEPASVERPYDLASLTKPLATATLLAELVERDLLGLDDPLSLHLDETAEQPFGAVTLRELALHTGGLPPWEPLYLHAASIEGYLRRIADLWNPAERGRVRYSDLGYIALGAVVARRAALPLDALFARRIAAPLGLARFGFATAERGFPDAAPTETGNAYERAMAGSAGAGFRWRETLIRGLPHDGNCHALGGVAGHAGLFGTVDGVAALAQSLLDAGATRPGPTRRLLLEAGPHAPGRTIGFVLARDSAAARGVLPDSAPGHTGFTGTSLWLDPPRGRSYVLLTNRVHPRLSPRDFQVVRREFHRVAAALAGPDDRL